MTPWLDDVRSWLPVASVVALAATTWSKVGSQEKRIETLEEQTDSLREWRAQTRERISNILRLMGRHDIEQESEEEE